MTVYTRSSLLWFVLTGLENLLILSLCHLYIVGTFFLGCNLLIYKSVIKEKRKHLEIKDVTQLWSPLVGPVLKLFQKRKSKYLDWGAFSSVIEHVLNVCKAEDQYFTHFVIWSGFRFIGKLKEWVPLYPAQLVCSLTSLVCLSSRVNWWPCSANHSPCLFRSP